MKYKVIIVGLGSIGLEYDLDNDSLNEVKTHAKAFQMHDDFFLVAGIDCDIEKRNIFEKKYKSKSFSSIDNALSEIQPEIVVIIVCFNVAPVSFFLPLPIIKYLIK